MASTISSALSSAPPTSRLNAPEEIQRPSDFASTHTESLFLEDERITEPLGRQLIVTVSLSFTSLQA
jgi:hypothetical protein